MMDTNAALLTKLIFAARRIAFWLLITCLCSCSRKIVLTRNIKKMNYSIRATDGKKVDGFLYGKFSKKRFNEKYFGRTKQFSSGELSYLKSIVNKKIPSEKMLLRKHVVNDSLGSVGVYGLSVIDFDEAKLMTYLGYDQKQNREVRSISFPVLKFEDDVKINTCSKCNEEDLKEVGRIIENFKIRYSEMFTAEEMKEIVNAFRKGMNVYTGHGRFRE